MRPSSPSPTAGRRTPTLRSRGAVATLRARLRRLGVERGDRVAILGRQQLRLGRRVPRRARPRRRRGAAQHAACRGRPRSGARRPRSRGDRRRSRVPRAGLPSVTGAGSSCRADVDAGRIRGAGAGRLRGAAGGGRRPLLHVRHHRRAARRDDPERVAGAERRDVRAHLPVRARTARRPSCARSSTTPATTTASPTCCWPTAGSTCRAGSIPPAVARALAEGRYTFLIGVPTIYGRMLPLLEAGPPPPAWRPGSPTAARRCRGPWPRA